MITIAHYIKELPKDAKKIKGALGWVDPRGNVYGKETRKVTSKNQTKLYTSHYGEYFKYSAFKNNHNGYIYAPVKYIINKKLNQYKVRQMRVHILVAEAFIENPNNLPIVGHKNNIKSDNRAENLYWTTYKENTQKAYDDGLLVNARGYEDSQSMPVIMFDTYTNKELGKYGSISIASKETGISKTTINRQAKYKRPVRKPYYFRFQDEAELYEPTIIIQYDFKTDKEVGRYFNKGEAERKTGISEKNIGQQCNSRRKPKWTKYDTYFLYSK